MHDAARANVALYKSVRSIIAGAETHVLTPPVAIDAPKGWMAVQHVQPRRLGGSDASVLFAYRLANSPESATFTLRDLPDDAVITASDPEAQVVRNGDRVTVTLRSAWRSTVLTIMAHD